MNVFYELGLKQIHKKKEELCGDSVDYSLRPGMATLVFSDGLGSGVKASILSTLTTRIAIRMLEQGLPLKDVVQTISETLPMCRVRKIAYSTFCMAQLSTEGHGKIAAYDSPPPFLVRGNKLQTLPYEDCQIAGKCISDYSFALRPGDWLVLVSDGVLNAGIGGAYPLGWGWAEVGKYLENHLHESLSAEAMAAKLATIVGELYEDAPGDDVSILVVKIRRKRVLLVLTGPPVTKENDAGIVAAFMSSPGWHVVCGGTTANIVARQLGKDISVDLETGTDEVPAAGRMDDLDLVTEGTLTLTKTLELIRSDISTEDLKLKVDAASRLAILLRDADQIRLFVGRAINPAHQNPGLPKNLGIKVQVIQALGDELKRHGKEVHTEYC